MLLRCLLFAWMLTLATDIRSAEDIAFVADRDGTQQRYVQVLPPDFDSENDVDVLIALHGHGSDRWQFIRQDRDECRAVRDMARERKMLLVTPDYRAPTSWMGPAAEADLLQIISRLRKQFRVRHVVLCGASMGGASTLTFAALHPDVIDGAVAMNGLANHVEYENFQTAIRQSFGGHKRQVGHEYRRRSAELWAHRLTMPTAFTVGGRDTSVPPDSVLRLAAQLKRDERPTLLIHRSAGGHATNYDDATTALRFVLDRLSESTRTEAADTGNPVDTAAGTQATDTNEPADLRLTLPSAFTAVAGKEVSIYFDNIVLTETPEQYEFDVQCTLGRTLDRRWTITPEPADTGTHEWSVTVRDANRTRLARATMRLHVVPAEAGKNRRIRLLLVGDSLTHATVYPNELAALLSSAGNPEWTMLGTHRPGNAAQGVRHEGYGGWTWQRFVSQYEPDPDGTHRKRSSPFVFSNPPAKPQLDVPRYFASATEGQRPDVVFFLLGINDCFSANPDDPAAIDARIDTMLGHAETLLAAFRQAAPEADLAICVTTPPNARESGFVANYRGRYHRWGWKRIQHRLVERLQRHFATSATGRQVGRVYVVPTHLNLDPVDGYPDNNGVHPNAKGYGQIGTSLYCWLKWWLAETAGGR